MILKKERMSDLSRIYKPPVFFSIYSPHTLKKNLESTSKGKTRKPKKKPTIVKQGKGKSSSP